MGCANLSSYASILKWMSFFNAEVLPNLGGWFGPLVGRDPYNKKMVEDSSKAALKAVSVVEDHLLHNTYLAGERVTLADLFAAGIISRGFQYFFDKKWREENPLLMRLLKIPRPRSPSSQRKKPLPKPLLLPSQRPRKLRRMKRTSQRRRQSQSTLSKHSRSQLCP